jgi:hypothetical protein
VPLRTPQSVFYKRYGTPALTQGAGTNFTCGLYYVVGYRPTELLWRACFRVGQLVVLSSASGVAHESGGRLVLNPPPPATPQQRANQTQNGSSQDRVNHKRHVTHRQSQDH